jgi:hypothetical protein
MTNPFKTDKTPAQRFEKRLTLMKPFISKYHNPIIVHAVHDLKTFKQILNDDKIKIPSKHSSRKKCLYMERLIGIDNAIYYSLGFVYSTAYDWKYSLIFDLDYVKKLIYYRNSVNYQCYKSVINYWYENDREYFDKFANFNSKTKEVIKKYLYEKYDGKVRMMFDFWKVEETTFNFIMKYPRKNKLLKIIKGIQKDILFKYPESKKIAKKDYLNDRIPEIVGKKDNNLLENPYFLGFYIVGKIPQEIKTIFKKRYSNKIFFDGNNIRKISDL